MTQQGPTFTPACGRLAKALYVHYLSKVCLRHCLTLLLGSFSQQAGSMMAFAVQVFEFTDTFIMVLKRNDRQISFLYLYHHASTFLRYCLVISLQHPPPVFCLLCVQRLQPCS